MIRHLGFQNMRAAKLINLAKAWLDMPPVKGVRWRTLNYPYKGAGRGIKPNIAVGDDDGTEGAWEVAHLPGCGDYAIDSWRIFCRDRLRGIAGGWDGEVLNNELGTEASEELGKELDEQSGWDGLMDPDFMPEWTRVLPRDKELRAFLRWRWLKEGFEWNPWTGEICAASKELVEVGELGSESWQEQRALVQSVLRGWQGQRKVVVNRAFVADSEDDEEREGLDGQEEQEMDVQRNDGEADDDDDAEFLPRVWSKKKTPLKSVIPNHNENLAPLDNARRRSGRIRASVNVAVQA